MAETDNMAPLPGVMPSRLPENAPAANFDPGTVAKALLRATRVGTLATIDRNTGHPFASLVNVATDIDGSPLILVSRLSTHTANLEKDGRASVLLASVGRGDSLAHPRLTVLGAFAPIARHDPREPGLRRHDDGGAGMILKIALEQRQSEQRRAINAEQRLRRQLQQFHERLPRHSTRRKVTPGAQ